MMVLKWWTILNVRKENLDLRSRQTLQAVISNPNDSRLNYIVEFGRMCLNMAGRQVKRLRQLTNDTATAMQRTCNGLVELTRHILIEESFDYVCMAEFSTGKLEKAFSKLRQGSGGIYFIKSQQVISYCFLENLLKILILINNYVVEILPCEFSHIPRDRKTKDSPD